MLKHQKPKIVICDFACLFDDEYALPSVSETIYRRIVDGTPDPAIRLKLIREICRVDPGQDPVSWLFPVFRYHSMWNEITADNFKWDKHEAITFEPFKKGAEAMPVHFDGEPYEITPALWETDRSPDELKEFSMHYYDMMIAECKENGIAVVGLLTPKVSDAAVYQTNYPVMQSYFDSRGVTGLNYNTYEQIERMGLSMEEDYMDAAHLNARGSEKFSRALAADLKAIFHDLPDRREDARISPSWDADLKSYHDMVEGAEAEYDQEHR